MTSLFFRSESGSGLCINGKSVEILVPELSIPLDLDHRLSLELLNKDFLGKDTTIEWRIPHPVIFLLANSNLANLNLLTLERPIVDSSLPGSPALNNLVSTPAICVWARSEHQVSVFDRTGEQRLGGMTDAYIHGGLQIRVPG